MKQPRGRRCALAAALAMTALRQQRASNGSTLRGRRHGRRGRAAPR